MEMDRSKAPLEQQMGLHNGSFTSRSRYWPVLNEILVALAEEGLFAIEAHKEYGPTQFEIALPPYPPVESVDVLLYARELIKDIAYRHGLIATIYPHAFAAAAGHHETNGQHIHISATPVKESSSFDPDQFLGGLLSHIPALCAICMASVDSYGRTARGHFGCGDFVAYGTNNRSTAIRLVSKNHWELRCVDATSNPYLMVAGMISAGLDSKPLTLEDIDKSPLFLSEEYIKKQTPMPRNMAQALQALQNDQKWAEKTFGEDILFFYTVNKKHEMEVYGKQSEEERKAFLVQYF